MAGSANSGGFPVDAEVRIEANDRAGLGRLLRYCARPAFALERLREIDAEHRVYESVKPGPGGSVSLMLTPGAARPSNGSRHRAGTGIENYFVQAATKSASSA